MSLAIGNIEDIAPDADTGCRDIQAVDTTLRYDRAKAELRIAEARGDGVSEATAEFVAARQELRAVLEMIWPER